MDTSLIIVAAGYSTRMGEGLRKPYLAINKRPIIFYSLEKFYNIPSINQIIVVVNELDMQMVKKKWRGCFNNYRVTDIVTGGRRRQDSVYNGLKSVSPDSEIVLIHDAVRPFVSKDVILQVIKKVEEYGAAIVAVPVKDTLKESGLDENILRTIPRANLWLAQTPQGFKRKIIIESYNKLMEVDCEVTDDSQIVERLGYSVAIIHGSYENIKITTPDDLKLAEAICKLRDED